MSDTTHNRRICLGMPGYSRPTRQASRGFWMACRDASQIVRDDTTQGSLLASNFNQLWCHALNIVHQGGHVDYFAMLHDDVGPEDYWLDTLIDELEAKQLDVLAVAVPVKDSRGMTSMALHKENDNWMPECRLSMYDAFQLPETFTSDDLGRPLLLNTGCWVCKFDMDWATQVHFEINDRIVFNRAQDRYQAQTEPEDWFFSRQLHEIGRGPTDGLRPLRIGATRKIQVIHSGLTHYSNAYPWGAFPYDSESATHSPVPGAFPFEIPGWLTPVEGKALAELSRGKRVLEIGSYCGLSTVCIARTADHVTAVDYFDGRETPAPQDTLPKFKANIERYGVAHKVEIRDPSWLDNRAESYRLPQEDYDVAFIDGAHDYESVQADIQKALAVLKPGGLLAFHDYREHRGQHDGRWDAGVSQSVNELLIDGGKLISTHDTLAVVSPPATILLEA